MSEPNKPLGLYPEPKTGLPDNQAPFLDILMNHWLDVRGDRLMPLRSEIDPTAIYQSLPHVWIYRFDPARDDFICELSGDHINTAWKRNITDAGTRELFPADERDTLVARWHYLLDHGLMMKTDFNLSRDLSFKPAERLTLPLTDEKGHAGCILGITVYSYKKWLEDEKDVAPPDINPRYFDGRPCAGNSAQAHP